MNCKRYPKSWKLIAHFLKSLNNWECESCGRPCRRPNESDQDLIARVEKLSQWSTDLVEQVWDEELGSVDVQKLGRFTLTVAHLDHDPPNCHPDNLRPWCTVCHCRYDIRAEAIARKQSLRLEYEGQLRLPGC